MNAIEVAQNHFNSWNRHDADAFVAAYAKGGIYRTPRAGHDLTGQAIGELVKSVWTAFPDASLELISIGDTGGELGRHSVDVARHPHRPVYGRHPGYRSHRRLSRGFLRSG
jgi:SnoaL-like domain